MLITEWQDKFRAAVLDRQYNIYPPAMVKALLTPETDAATFMQLAAKYFAPYESLTVTSTPYPHIAGPRELWNDIADIENAPPEPEALLTETGGNIQTESGGNILLED